MNFLDFLLRPGPSNVPPLLLRNTLSGKLEEFRPLSRSVKMYTCGPTVYDLQHIGNLLPPVVANVLRRTLEVWGHSVEEVNNITDFGHISEDEASEDKMTKGLRREGMALSLSNMRALAEKYAAKFLEDLPHLGIDPGRVSYPRASDYIPEQIALIQTLEQKGFAYRTSDGLYFDVSKYPDYGKLGGIELSELKTGARVEENPEKRMPYDFALWKLDKKLGWKSPWGLGFPGWHTECVAVIFKLLGKQIDIHVGGSDLIPIHHNNEIAEAEAATGKPFVTYWIHNAHITVESKKISKSIGNTIYLHNLVDRGLSPRSLRYWFLTGHYRTPMNFTWDVIAGANTALMRLNKYFFESPGAGTPNEDFLKNFYQDISQDLDTPSALAKVWDLIRDSGQYMNISRADKKATLTQVDRILGLGLIEARPLVKIIPREELPEDIQKLVGAREVARASREFKEADTLRGQIEARGYEVKDTARGPTITKKA